MKYYLIAGEASGDLHGSNLMKVLKQIDAEAIFRCWGGDLMQQAGGTLVKHYKDLAFMGFAEVVKHLPVILQNFSFCKKDIKQFQPHAVILIDYPGFNLRMAKWSKQHSYKTIFYIAPQVWAWKESRVKSMKKHIDKMLVILPFEKDYFEKKWNWQVEYVGHPLVKWIENFKLTHNNQPEETIVALLPGSRKQEIEKKLPIMLQVSTFFPECKFVVAKAAAVDDAFYNQFLEKYTNVSSVRNNTYALLSQASAALVTSGTATLETALFGVPQVVCYKGSQISYFIGRWLIKVPYISLVNLTMNKPVVKELIQQQLTVENIQNELRQLLYNKPYRLQIKQDYALLKQKLSEQGDASFNAAKSIAAFLKP